MKNIFKIFGKSDGEPDQKNSLHESLKIKYLSFQNLLRDNNIVLELIADMEEKLSGEYLFDRNYINSQVGLVTKGVFNIIENINKLSNDKYLQLEKQFASISSEIEKTLTCKAEIPITGFTISLDDIDHEMNHIAGGKMSSLGEMRKRLHLPTPDGFVITAYAFKRFMEHNVFTAKINDKLSALKITDMKEIIQVSTEIQNMVAGAEIPDDLQHTVDASVERLRSKMGRQGELMVSVRSSAAEEDGECSFAGQYATFLNVPAGLILQKYKEVVASLFTHRAIFYYKTRGFSEEKIVMAVGVLEMINARTAGVTYTTDPNNPENDGMIINAVWGLGKAVVEGTENPNAFIVSKHTGSIIEEIVPVQKSMYVCTAEGDMKNIDVPEEIKYKKCLTDEQIKTLYDYASTLETHYGRAQDIEWAIGDDENIYLLQSRHLMIINTQRSALKAPRRIEKYKILLDKGVIACKGVGYGKAFIVRDENDLEGFPEAAVLVARHTSTRFVTVMNKASAIVTDIGGAAGHMASISREYQVPTIVDCEQATAVIKNGQEITVDAINCTIYEGKVDELIAYAEKKKEPFKETKLFKLLERTMKWIVPLNLFDPAGDNFHPEHCRSFHDITRFSHEKAMAEMFQIGEGHEIEEKYTIALSAGIPINVHMVNIDGGVKDNLKKAAYEDILSIPFSALLKGMKGIRWPEPRPADVKGFFGMIAHTASIPEEEIRRTAQKSFAVVSGNYMNFSIRLGYHFSQIEAYAGDNMNDNYIKFFFKGGGAAADRRLRRARLISEILRKMDFKIKVTQDVIEAILPKYRQKDIEERLDIMGRLTAYTKQLDMVMYNDVDTDMFIEAFVRDHMKKAQSE